jgi:hypothetical protein
MLFSLTSNPRNAHDLFPHGPAPYSSSWVSPSVPDFHAPVSHHSLNKNNSKPENVDMRTPAIRILALATALGLAAGVQAQPRAITNQLVVHLSFDNTLNDDSGRGNNAVYNSTNGLAIQPAGPTYVPGKLGKGFQFNTYPDGSLIEYATLGYPVDLQFDVTNDFSVSFWFNTYATNIVGGGDPAIIANRNWNSSSSRGWGVFLQGGLTTVRFHLTVTEPSTSKLSVRPATPANENLYDGAWHHLAFTCQRGGVTKVYVDGVLENTSTYTASSATFDTYTNLVGLLLVPETVNVGQDGTGTYTQGSGNSNPPAQVDGTAGVTNAAIDDLGIWRRVLTDLEVASIYNFAQLGTNLYNVPDVHTPIVVTFSPPNNSSGVSPYIPVTASIIDQNTHVNTNTLLLIVDGVSVPFTLTQFPGTNDLSYTQPFLSAPGSLHTNKLIFADDNTPTPNRFTNTAVYSIVLWSNIYLPTPIYLETFDEVVPATSGPPGAYPAGWSATNCTTLFGGWDLTDPVSDAYADWQTTPITNIVSHFNYDGRILNVFSPLFVNGALITNPLGSNNIVFAASDQRNGDQYDVMFTGDYNLSGQTNIYMAYNNMYSQENGQLGAIEYSINQGATWLPVVYMIDPRAAIITNGVVDPWSTMTNDFTRVPPDNCAVDTTRTYYGQYIAVAQSQWGTLAPYISLRAGSDHVTWHTVERFRLPQADNAATVRFRFVMVGNNYWDWGFDNFGLYSITEQPLQTTSVSKSGASVTINWNGTGVNSASALQKNTSLSAPAGWVTIPGTIGLSTYTEPASTGPVYYRAVRY